ncbi:MAG TPA: tyrosine-type recombinase/integrase, partial [Spirochaetia bacterium]|nr:tyrosine-type recombinase/integrase [Spirochaetia bacterium]
PRTLIDMQCTFTRLAVYGRLHHPEIALYQWRLDDYLRWIEHERQAGQALRSIAKELSHLRGFLAYAWRNGRTDRNVLDGFQLQDAARPAAPPVLTIPDMTHLVAACARRTPLERRDRLIVLLLYGGGLRTGEVCGLDLGDVDRERQELLIRHAKGDVDRRVPVPPGVWTELLAFLADRGRRPGALLRTAATRRRIDAGAVCAVVTITTARAGLPAGITPRTLRHTFATHLMDRGVPLDVIASLLGHRSPRESGVYLHALPARETAAVDRLSAAVTP